MKKSISVLLIFCMFALCSCSSKKNVTSGGNTETQTSSIDVKSIGETKPVDPEEKKTDFSDEEIIIAENDNPENIREDEQTPTMTPDAQGTNESTDNASTQKVVTTATPTKTNDTTASGKSTASNAPVTTKEPTQNGDSIVTEGNNRIIKAAGTYTFSGNISGNIIVDAGETDVVEIVLNNAKISSSSAAPIYSKCCETLKIIVNSGTYNEIIDNRANGVNNEDTVTGPENAKGSIYAEQDLKIKGSGALVVTGSYNNGIHTKDDLEIDDVTMKVTAANHALKGNDEVKIDSGEITLISTSGNCIKTSNAEISEKGNQKGNIIVNGGNISIKSGNDGINAAYECIIAGGNLTISANDDGIHADSLLTINGGYINVVTSYEGIEAKYITVNDGYLYIYAKDDGINAAGGAATQSFGGRPGGSGSSNCTFTINGGYVDVTTPSGDTDAVDCNGSYYQTGGFMFIKGGSSAGGMSGSLDVDGSVEITGGTTIALGGICETPNGNVNAYVMNRISFPSGDYSLTTGGSEVLSFSLKSQYSSGWICSTSLETGKLYKLTCGSQEIASWTQEAGTMGETGSNQPGFNPGGPGGPGGYRPSGRR